MVIPKYARVQSGIINLIALGNIGEEGLLPTEKELAKRFDVSIITVRRAVQNLEDMDFLRCEQGKGTFVTSTIPGKIDNGSIVFLNIGKNEQVLPSFDSSGDFMGKELLKRGYHLQVLMSGQVPSSSVVQSLSNVRGVIATGWVNGDWVNVLNALSIPVVFLGSEVSGELDIPSIDFDWAGMAEMLTTNLVSRGMRKLGLIIGGEDYAPSLWMRNGFQKALKQSGIDFSPSLVCYSDESSSQTIDMFLRAHDDFDGFVIERGCYVHVLNSLLNRTYRPTMAIMSSHFIKSAGVCDNMIEAIFRENIYERSVELLFALMESNEKRPNDIKIPPYLQGENCN